MDDSTIPAVLAEQKQELIDLAVSPRDPPNVTLATAIDADVLMPYPRGSR